MTDILPIFYSKATVASPIPNFLLKAKDLFKTLIIKGKIKVFRITRIMLILDKLNF